MDDKRHKLREPSLLIKNLPKNKNGSYKLFDFDHIYTEGDKLLEEQFNQLIGRDLFHIHRIFNHSNSVEKQFALAYIRNINSITAKHSTDRFKMTIINEILGGEGKNTTMFWTLVPYIYKHLLESGVESSKTFDYILKWLFISFEYFRDVNIMLRDLPLRLFWIGNIEYEFVLDMDAEHLSHIVANEHAKIIVSNLIKTEEP